MEVWDPSSPGFWLTEYFSQTLEIDRCIFPSMEDLGRECVCGKVIRSAHIQPSGFDTMDPIPGLLSALRFAAHKHRDHRRKDPAASPYINHPIEVAELLANVGNVSDLELLQAAILHDTIEDTDTTSEELEEMFGARVRGFVDEVTDDKRLPRSERKRRQIANAAGLSPGAKQLKIADKICNVRDITRSSPRDWSLDRRREYLEWSRRVVEGCAGINLELDREFDTAFANGMAHLEAS